MIDNDKLRQQAIEQIEFLQRTIDCDHNWIETGRRAIPSFDGAHCIVHYHCDKCDSYVNDRFPLKLEDYDKYL